MKIKLNIRKNIYIALRFFIGLLLFISGILKLLNINDFISSIQGYNLFANQLSNIISVIICLSEILLGLSILLGYFLKKVFFLVILMLGIFTFFNLWAVITDKNWVCECFGSFLSSNITYTTVFRDVLFLLITIILSKTNKTHYDYNNLHDSKKKILYVIVVLISILFIIFYYSNNNYKSLKIGANLPQFRFKSINGKEFNSKIRKQPYLMVILFSLDDCRTCLLESLIWQKLSDKYKTDIQVIGITNDRNKKLVATFVKMRNLKFPIWAAKNITFLDGYNFYTPIRIMLNSRNVIINIEQIVGSNINGESVFLKKFNETFQKLRIK